MLDLYELEQFVSFAELGTLSRVAEKFAGRRESSLW